MVDQAVSGSALPIAAVVLAAGSSRRLGRPKQLLVLGGETLLERAVRTAHAAGLQPVFAVVNAALANDHTLTARLAASGSRVLVNKDAGSGMSSSIRCGVRELAHEALHGVVLMTCDQVAVTPDHLRDLCAKPAETAASGYGGRVGVPAYFPATLFAELRALDGDKGARHLLKHARVITVEALALDVDTEDDVTKAEQWLGGKARG